MTISYSDQFLRLLFRWTGSLWKSLWKDLLLFLILYYSINTVYRRALTVDMQQRFLKLIRMFNDWTNEIPLTFLLGFYVGMIIRRWWQQVNLISFPDNLLFNVSALIRGKDPETRIIRRSIARYCLLASVLAWRSISLRVLKRYPTDEHLVQSGLITRAELTLLNDVPITVDPHKHWFVPLNWIQSILVRCFEKGTMTHVNELLAVLESLRNYREGFFHLFIYDWFTIPLVYTQVATISVYGYFALALVGRQFPNKNNDEKEIIDLYIPVFTILQFLFYVGWLKVGEDLMFPFGVDDEDFEFNYILDRNLEIGYLIADDLHLQLPPIYVEQLNDIVELKHTNGSRKIVNHPPKRHVSTSQLSQWEMSIEDEEEEEQQHHHRSESQPYQMCCKVVYRGEGRELVQPMMMMPTLMFVHLPNAMQRQMDRCEERNITDRQYYEWMIR